MDIYHYSLLGTGIFTSHNSENFLAFFFVDQIYIEVALPVPMRQLFTYQVPASMQSPTVVVGERVIVPFAGRQLVGIVLTISDKTTIEETKLKPILSRVTDKYRLTESLINFLKTLSQYYHHPIGDICQQALPVLLRQLEQPDLSFQSRWFTKEIAEKEAEKIIGTRARKQLELYDLIQQNQSLGQGYSWPELRTLGFSKTQLTALETKALIEEKEVIPSPFTWQAENLSRDNRLSLSAEQAVIVSAVNQSTNTFSCHLIDGITGI